MSERVLPEGWREVTLRELVAEGVLELGDGYRTKSSELGEGGYRIVRAADISADRVRLESSDFVAEEFAHAIGPKAARAGDVVLTTKGTVGRVAVMPELTEPAVYAPQLCYFRTRDSGGLSSAYLRYWLQSSEFLEQASYMQGNTDMAPYISLSDLRSAGIVLRPLNQQRAIAEVLGALDDKIAANETLSQILSQSIASEWQVLARRSPLGTLGDLVRLDYGKALPASVRQEGAVPVYGSGGIVGQHALGLVQGPAVIVGRKGTVGSVYWSEAPCFAIDTTFIAVPHAPHTLEYVHEALKSAPLAETNADSAVPGLNRMEAYATPIAIPNLQSETEFASKAAVLRRRALGAEQESRALTATRDALLPALMSGRQTVRDAEAVATGAGL